MTKRLARVIFIKMKETFNIHDIDVHKLLIFKNNHMVKKTHSNTWSGIVIITALDHCATWNDWVS